MESPRPLDDKLKITTLVSGQRKISTTTPIVVPQAYFYMEAGTRNCGELTTAPHFPNPTTGHIALTGQQERKERTTSKKGEKERKEETAIKTKKTKGKAKASQETTKIKDKEQDTTKGEKDTTSQPPGALQAGSTNSWSTPSGKHYNNNACNEKGKGKGRSEGKPSTTTNSVQRHICKKLGHARTVLLPTLLQQLV